jgi:hypothetical protein
MGNIVEAGPALCQGSMTATEIIFGLNSVKNALTAGRRRIFQLFAYHNPAQAKRYCIGTGMGKP